jgi:hypothetical protein
MTNPTPKPSSDAVYEDRKAVVRAILNAESAALDARSAQLKALRLARDAAAGEIESAVVNQARPGAAPAKQAAQNGLTRSRLKKLRLGKKDQKPAPKSLAAKSRGPKTAQKKAWARIDKGPKH